MNPVNVPDAAPPKSSMMGVKQPQLNALQRGPRKQPVQDPLVHHGRHFGHVIHSFCSVLTLLTNGLAMMCELEDRNLEMFSDYERKEYSVFYVIAITELIQRGANGARADDTKGMKCTIIDWITPKGQTLNPHIPCNAKSARGFNHEHTSTLLCPAGYDWSNAEIKEKLCNGQLRVARDQWPIFLYANYAYDAEDPWNSLLCYGILISAYKYIFTSPSSIDLEEPKATCSCNARNHGMHSVTKASIAYVATQARFALTSAQVFSHTDLLTDSEQFYNSILELLDDPDE
ncbi:hypothetical protein JVT61DRAFT_1615 [Boletus reticuloceps]|uniref:Uncharacterized protein n=1 Tax=Boletus reticuloceps TaxID=495285 RepID=A0A8I2YR53_9AGAM|nr:hypothetical protein JVT61DRAFT_1615 [Boletus reticuloceps]